MKTREEMSKVHKDLFRRAVKGDVTILKHPMVGEIKDLFGETPLHHLAFRGKVEVLDHPMAKKVRNRFGETPADLLPQKTGQEK